MKHILLQKTAIFVVFVVLLCSCASRKDMIYYQDVDNQSNQKGLNSYEIKIQPDDLLLLTVYADDAEAVKSFNLNMSTELTSGSSAGSSYLVDANGYIDLPTVGKFKISGLSRSEALQSLEQELSKYIKKPIVSLRISNFKVSVQGEVAAPGSYPIASERVTLIEALSMAGDLTVYGKRNNILVIREVEGVRSYNRIDITKAEFMNSPFYYLSQNDVVYVEPNQNKIDGSAVGPSINLIFSVTGILISLATFIITTLK
jgi:polysaccharide export outer membrane protein